MIDLVETLFLALLAITVPAIMLGLIVLIIYAVYREVRGGE